MKKIILGLLILCLMATAAFAADVPQTVQVSVPPFAILELDNSYVVIQIELVDGALSGMSGICTLTHTTSTNAALTAQAQNGFGQPIFLQGYSPEGELRFDLTNPDGNPNGVVNSLAGVGVGSGSYSFQLKASVAGVIIPADNYSITVVYSLTAQ